VGVFVHYSPHSFGGVTLVRIDSFNDLPRVGELIQIAPGWNELVKTVTWVNEDNKSRRRPRLHVFCQGLEKDVIPPQRFVAAGFKKATTRDPNVIRRLLITGD
jgi:hypothetical protein